MNTRFPDFFIVGAPKAGTTSLYEYLKQHPQIFMGPKEIYHFADDLLKPDDWVLDRERYLALFDGVKSQQLLGEASVLYLQSENAARNIYQCRPDAKIIIMLRNPVDYLYSRHSELLFNREEDIEDFSEALAAEPDRQQGRRIPPHTRIPKRLQYRRYANFDEQITRYFESFGREQVHVIIFDDFKQDALAACQGVLAFLQLPIHNDLELRVVNTNKKPRSQFLQDLIKTPPKSLKHISKNLPFRVRRMIRKIFRQVNAQSVKRTPMNPKLKYQLQTEFQPQIDRLSVLLSRDLSHWYQS